jgi:hypothetical protein
MSATAITASRLRSRVPPDLAESRVWACYRSKTDKAPLQPNGAKVESNNPATWSMLDECLQAVADGRMYGVGYMIDPLAGPDPDDDTPDVEDQNPYPNNNSWLDVVEDFVTVDFLADLAERSAGMDPIGALLEKMAATSDPQQYLHGAMLIITRAFDAGKKTKQDQQRAAWRQRKAAARAAEAAEQAGRDGDRFPGTTAKAIRQLKAEGRSLDDMTDDEVHAEIMQRWPNCTVTPAAVQRVRRPPRGQ